MKGKQVVSGRMEYEIVERAGQYELRSRPVVEWTVRGVFALEADAVLCKALLSGSEENTSVAQGKRGKAVTHPHDWAAEEQEVLERYRGVTPWPYKQIRAELQKVRPGGPFRSNSAIIARYSRTEKVAAAANTDNNSAAVPPEASATEETEAARAENKEPPLAAQAYLRPRKCLLCGFEWQGQTTDPCPNEAAHRHIQAPSQRVAPSIATTEPAPSFIKQPTREQLMGGGRPKF